jgi:hypothetical protein
MPKPYVHQALQVLKHDEMNAELRVTTVDEAASLLWAAQWLDEHREYGVTEVRLDNPSNIDDDEPGTSTLVIRLHMFSEPEPARFGPWNHGVPPIPM